MTLFPFPFLCYCFIYYICRCYICGNIYYNCCLVWCLLKNLREKEGVCVCIFLYISHIFTISAALSFFTMSFSYQVCSPFLSSGRVFCAKYASKKFSSGFILYYIQIHFWMIASDGFRILCWHSPTSSPLAIWLCHSTALWPPYFFYKTLAVNRIVLLYAVIWFFLYSF